MQEETRKRKKNHNPGVRIQGSRIYDSENGRTCHQCRQKTCDKSAHCKAVWKGKPCTQYFCSNCLFNRYSEVVDEVRKVSGWSCPRCREECNCSICRKRLGLPPTGILVHAAKASGYLSVKDMLHGTKTEKDEVIITTGYSDQDIVRGASPSKGSELEKENIVSVPFKVRNEPIVFEYPAKARQKNELGQIPQKEVGCLVSLSDSPTQSMEMKACSLVKNKHGSNLSSDSEKDSTSSSKRKLDVFDLPSDGEAEGVEGDEETDFIEKRARISQYPLDPIDQSAYHARLKKMMPKGQKLNLVEGVDFEEDLVSGALQLVEFLHAFSKTLGITGGQARSILKELQRGGIIRRAEQSAFVQLHVKLLKMILSEDSNILSSLSSEEKSWLVVLSKHLVSHPCPPRGWSKLPCGSASQEVLLHEEKCQESDVESKNPQSEDALEDTSNDVFRVSSQLAKGAEGYANLKLQEKLELLNMLCDDALETNVLRSYIEQAADDNVEKLREKRDAVSAVRKEVKEAKEELQKQKNIEVAKRIEAAKNPKKQAALEKHLRLLEKSRLKLQSANEKLIAAKGPNGSPGNLALRTEPILFDPFGRSFWRLHSGTGSSQILMRGPCELLTSETEGEENKVKGDEETWTVFSKEQIDSLEAYFSACREGNKRQRKKRVARPEPDTPTTQGGFGIYC